MTMNPALAIVLLSAPVFSAGDTLVEVRRGDHLVLKDFEGRVVVETWDRPEVWAQGELKGGYRFRTTRSGNDLVFRPSRRSDDEEGIRVTAPPWVSLEIQGRETEVRVGGFEENVRIRTLDGDVNLVELSGTLDVYSAEGEITAVGLTGSARIRSGDGDIEVRGSSADLDVETVEGEIRLEHLESRRISAEGTSGEIEFTGRVFDGGQYIFLTHEGDVFLSFVPPVNLDATVLAYHGEFTSDFPVRATGFRSGEGIQFRTGEGGTTLRVETFSGEVRIRRVGEGAPRQPGGYED
jgi:hypothetical protein